MTATPGGSVAIVGAGPGDPELLTLKGRRLLEAADVVVHDRLIPRELLDLAPSAERYDVGKQPSGQSAKQDEIDALLVRLARAGRRVVRLKGGDPFIFGRSGSELEALVAAGIPFEVVPGVTAAIAAPAYAGVPVTDRRFAGAVVFVTATQDASAPLDWSAIARVPTVVVLMGAARAGAVADALIAHGVPRERSAVAVQWGTTPRQRVVTSTLGRLAREMAAAHLNAPVTIVVGEVARLASRYSWFDPSTLTPSRSARARPLRPIVRRRLPKTRPRSRSRDTTPEPRAAAASGDR